MKKHRKKKKNKKPTLPPLSVDDFCGATGSGKLTVSTSLEELRFIERPVTWGSVKDPLPEEPPPK